MLAQCQRCHRLSKPPQKDFSPELQQQINEVIRDELDAALYAETPAGDDRLADDDAEARDLDDALRASLATALEDRRRKDRADKAASAAERRRRKDKKLAEDIKRRVTETHQGPQPRKVRAISPPVCHPADVDV